MKLSNLLTEFYPNLPSINLVIQHLALDSRLVSPGAAFFAFPGTHQDGRQFIEEAIQKGAVAVFQEGEEFAIAWRDHIPLISFPHLRDSLSQLAARFYDYPTQKLQIVGVTGTSGKTSCTQFLGAALQQLHIPCGISGTLGHGLYGAMMPATLTTPDAITLQKILAECVAQGIEHVAMEVSSHSLDQGRVNAIEFAIGIFTNLTRDHLDYHGSMEAYGAAKKRLFAQSRCAIVNVDDPFGKIISQSLPTPQTLFTYSVQDTACDVYASNAQLTAEGIHAHVMTPWGSGELQTSIVGQFNLSNLLAVLTALCVLEIPFQTALACLSRLNPVAGRMQAFGGALQPLVVVDYAHKPDALEKVLFALRQQCQGKLYCIFGCGGDRDRGKRPMMASIAEHYADQVIVTDDNPRYEDPAQIVQDILQGFKQPEKVIVQHDRAKAIRDVIHYAKPADCILIAGKGAETYQQISGVNVPFSDLVQVTDILGEFHASLAK